MARRARSIHSTDNLVVTEAITLAGHVQGVGFRPFVYRLAKQYGLRGWVQNQLGQVAILAQGPQDAVETFVRDLVDRSPPLSKPKLVGREPADPADVDDFLIIESSASSEARIFVPPDYFTCADCLAELHDPADRRYRYPFINCTQCGPRYTLIRQMPYDRPNTSMADFPLCLSCRGEYEDPLNRRFHAEPVACPDCGPALEFVASSGTHVEDTTRALTAAVEALRSGKIVAVKGIGGYHLMCDARNDASIAELRARKPRPHKPLAVMLRDPETARLEVDISADCLELLTSPVRPIVLCEQNPRGTLSSMIAPGLREVGVFLPYSPLHHLLLSEFGGPLVATSGNISGEPVLTDNKETERRLKEIAHSFLHHNRPIVRPADDPVFRPIGGRLRPIRLGRGCAPLELNLPVKIPRPVLAVGAHMKNTIALGWEDRVVVSPHIGEMDTPRSLEVFEIIIKELQELYDVKVEQVVCDAHPGYTTSRWAGCSGLPVVEVLHHVAHASALAGEHSVDQDWLVFAWDGVGYGADGTLWGGETVLGRPGQWRRVGSMRPFFLPGGEKAGREPWRSAAALCWETDTVWPGCPDEQGVLHHAWQRRLNSPQTTAVGRLFDAAAALVVRTQQTSYEGQGPMQFEACSDTDADPVRLPLIRNHAGVWETDWSPLLPVLMDDHISVGERAAIFHVSLAQAMVDQARAIVGDRGSVHIGLSGGVFQNRLLVRHALERLAARGFMVALGERVPSNDAGISYGQVIEAAARQTQE